MYDLLHLRYNHTNIRYQTMCSSHVDALAGLQNNWVNIQAAAQNHTATLAKTSPSRTTFPPR